MQKVKKIIARLLFWPVTWLFIEILEELKDEIEPKDIAKKLREGKWIITRGDGGYEAVKKYL